MAKVLKAVVVGALVGLTAGLAFPALAASLSITFVGGLTVTGLTAVVTGGAILGGLVGVSATLTDFPNQDLDNAISRLQITTDPQARGKWVFGNTAMGADIMYAENHGSDDEFQSLVIAGAAHTIESFGDLYVDDDQISLSGNAATGDYADTLWVERKLGATTGQTALQQGLYTGDGWTWPSTAKGEAIAHYRLAWRLGKEKTKNGPSRRITQICKGAPVYDPRLDSTVGGSGAHRANDQTTWEYENGGTDIGENWALVVLFYLLGWRANSKLVFGVGVDPNDIDYTQAIAAANVCEETVDSKSRYKIGGILETSNDHDYVIGQLEAAIGGKIAVVGGKYYIWAPNDDLSSPFSSISGDEMVTEYGVEHQPSGPLQKLFNTANGRFIDPSQLYQPVAYPEVAESTYVTEDGKTREMDRDFSVIQESSIAQRVARMLVRRSRFTATWLFAMGPSGLRFRPFDVTTFNCIETNNANETVRIINMEFSVTGRVVLECMEEHSDIYDTTAALGTELTQNNPPVDVVAKVAVSSLAAATISLTGSSGTATDGFKITWDDPSTYVDFTEVQFKRTTDSDYINVPDARVDFTHAIIEPVEPGTAYDIRTRHISINGIVGDWASVVKTSSTTQKSYNVVNVEGVSGSTVTTAVTNFNNRNDRNATTPVAPTIPGGGSAIDHTTNKDGSVDISVEWTYSAGNEGIIDGFIVYHYTSTGSGAYTIGTTPASEAAYPIPASERSFFFRGVAADLYHTFGLQAYRYVDEDIDSDQVIVSTVSQPSAGDSENPYRPSANVAFTGDLTGTINGTTSSDVLFVAGGGTFTGSLAAHKKDKTIGMYLNSLSFAGGAGSNNGECYLFGYDKEGAPADVDFSFWADGELFTTGDGGETTSNKIHNVYGTDTRSGDRWLYIVYDTAEGRDFTVFSATRNVCFAYHEGDQWYYDNNGSDVKFTPKDTYYAIGIVYHDDSANKFANGAVFQEGIPLWAVPSTFPSDMKLLNSLATGGIISTFSVAPITNSTDAGATATINIGASTLNVGAKSISYNSGSITGLSFETLYNVYTDDPGYEGGAVTYVATTDVVDLAEADGRISFGAHTTVADGGGTGGSAQPPGDWCVGVDMFCRNVKAGSLEKNMLVNVLSANREYHHPYYVSSVEFAKEPCVVIAAGGAWLVCSETTPITLQDGSVVCVIDSLGEEVAVLDGTEFSWEKITTLKYVGPKRVAKVHVNGRTYAAGADPEHQIFTHNPYKP